MRIIIHSGTAQGALYSLNDAMRRAQEALHRQGVYFLGDLPQDGDLITQAALPLGSDHPLLGLRGRANPEDHQQLIDRVRALLANIVLRHHPRILILTLSDAAIWLDTPELLDAARALLSEFSDDIRGVLHNAHPASALADLYVTQVIAGRQTGLEQEGHVGKDRGGWWRSAMKLRAQAAQSHQPAQIATPFPAIDGPGLVRLWLQVFGADALFARELPPHDLTAETLAEVARDLGLQADMTCQRPVVTRPSIGALSRMLTVNEALFDLERALGPIPLALRRAALRGCADDRRGLRAEDVALLTAQLREMDGDIVPVIRPDERFDPRPLLSDFPQKLEEWRAARVEPPVPEPVLAPNPTPTAAPKKPMKKPDPAPLSPAAQRLLNERALEVLTSYEGTRFAPSNKVTDPSEANQPVPCSSVPGEATNSLIVACMKNEGPYIIEWIAYHLAIGVGHFLIFTNDCSDGTVEILDRLGEMGYVTRRDNEEWKGKSPQQHALNTAIRMDVLKRSEWVIHIDVDEYMNIRIGDGTMTDLLDAMGPDATNLAMTWRLFGNNGVDFIEDGAVMERFTGCSPSYAPKPHTIWGFKTMTRNIGAYEKLSCHRPNKWDGKTPVKWLNGSLADTTKAFREKGWRNSVPTIGFDAIELNHYALRSRESFLIKRQRGRALHVDRSIGLNYWIRHDWNQNEDRTILRQLPRMEAMRAKLMADPELARLQADALAWHKQRAADLRQTDAFRELWDQSADAELTDAERVAYSVAADLDS